MLIGELYCAVRRRRRRYIVCDSPLWCAPGAPAKPKSKSQVAYIGISADDRRGVADDRLRDQLQLRLRAAAGSSSPGRSSRCRRSGRTTLPALARAHHLDARQRSAWSSTTDSAASPCSRPPAAPGSPPGASPAWSARAVRPASVALQPLHLGGGERQQVLAQLHVGVDGRRGRRRRRTGVERLDRALLRDRSACRPRTACRSRPGRTAGASRRPGSAA